MEKLPKFTSFDNLLFVALFAVLVACSQPAKETADVLIQGVTLIDPLEETVREGMDVAIKADTISYIGKSGKKDFEAQAVLSGAGRFLIPGLWDNHVHFRGGDTLAAENKTLLSLYLDYGVTTVRDAGGDITPYVLNWRQAIQEGTLEGPTLFTSGPKLDGPGRAWPGSIPVNSEQSIESALDSLDGLGVDYVKIYDYSLDRDIYYRILEEATKRGYQTTGHMPMSATLKESIQRGLNGTEHNYYALKGCSSKEDSLTALGIGYGVMNAALDTYDEETAQDLFEQLADKDFYITPTFYIGKVLGNLYQEDHADDSLLSAIPQGIQKTYEGRIASAIHAGAAGADNRMKMYKQGQEMIRSMHENGIPVLAGSDCGPYNSFVYPGEGLHGELRELVNCGFTPMQALRMSVVNGPKFFNALDRYGSIRPGKMADLLLLRQNPLDNIENLTAIQAVISRGKVVRER